MKSIDFIDTLIIDDNHITIKTKAMSKPERINKHLFAERLNIKITNSEPHLIEQIYNAVGCWMGNKLYKSTCRMEGVA